MSLSVLPRTLNCKSSNPYLQKKKNNNFLFLLVSWVVLKRRDFLIFF